MLSSRLEVRVLPTRFRLVHGLLPLNRVPHRHGEVHRSVEFVALRIGAGGNRLQGSGTES